jgi:hypothetical protein
MAQILLVTRRLDAQLEAFRISLQSEQQSVHVVTTESNSTRNFIEAVSTYLRLQPDLVYFVLSNEKTNRLERILFDTLGQLPHIKVAVSFTGHVPLKDSRSLKRLLQKAELLTFASRKCLSDMRGFTTKSKKQFRALLSPQVPIEVNPETQENGVSDLMKYLSREKIWVTFGNPDYLDTHSSFFEGLAREKTWVFLGDRTQWRFSDHEKFQYKTAHWKHQPIWFPYSTHSSLLQLFKQAEVFVMADHQLSPLDLSRFSQLSALSGIFTILDTHQIEPHSRLWTVGDNCELIEKDQSRQIFENSWLHRLTRNFDYRKKPRSSARASDDQLNEFNRWIAKTLAEPRRI